MVKRKKNKTVMLAISAVAVILGIVAIVMMFVPSIGIKDSDTTFKGMEATFGYQGTVPVIGTKYTVFEFSIMNLISYILVAGGVVFTILGALGRGSKFAGFIAAGAFVVAGVFFFLMPQYTVINSDATMYLGNLNDNLTLGAGAIVSAVCSLLAGAAQLYRILFR